MTYYAKLPINGGRSYRYETLVPISCKMLRTYLTKAYLCDFAPKEGIDDNRLDPCATFRWDHRIAVAGQQVSNGYPI